MAAILAASGAVVMAVPITSNFKCGRRIMGVERAELDTLLASANQEDLEYLVEKFYGKCYAVQYRGDPDSETRKQLETCCKEYAAEIDAIIAGGVKKCGVCKEPYVRKVRKSGEVVYAPNCGCKSRKPVEYTLREYMGLEDGSLYDAEYIIGGNGNFIGVRYALGTGGPSYWVDTVSQFVEGYWGGDSYKYPLSGDAVSAIYDLGEEKWDTVSNYTR